ncbi:hypothetical protein [Qipengyuania sp.]|uniref:hypothetical protein n=1 Tax=Qipengyuania sp. TaxID=2004515 RepID=UPI003AF9FB61
MFGPRLTTVFASRWRALWFAGAILLTAYCSVPAPEETDLQQAEAQARTSAKAHAANPWALDEAG